MSLPWWWRIEWLLPLWVPSIWVLWPGFVVEKHNDAPPV
jgi:hypothetical protein